MMTLEEARDRFYDEHDEIEPEPTCEDCLFLNVPEEKWFGVQEFGWCGYADAFMAKTDKTASIDCPDFQRSYKRDF